MPVARHVKRPKLASTPRHDVSAPLPQKLDAVLKDLRGRARRLSVLQPCLQDELRILERLYYKGLNQHRSALFWRRVEDIRRIGKRVLEVQLRDLTDDLRYAFYVEEDKERNPKILRGAWSQVPDAKFVNYVLERTKGSIELITESRKRFANAYHSFSLMMQTGAFLQLTLALTAIASRLDALAAELGAESEMLSEALYTLLVALGAKKAKAIPRGHEPAPAEQPRFGVREDTAEEFLDEDLGSTVIRKNVVETEPSKNVHQEGIFSGSSYWQQSQYPVHSDMDTSTRPESTASSLIISKANVSHSVIATSDSNLKQPKKAKEKKKKRKDEIDDIFGSL
ncbi:hypothetical protein M0805_009307 [Coniferiporia weirii]|nr:hypothetical protein M0805_009307 [Coniferiporia weirii]